MHYSYDNQKYCSKKCSQSLLKKQIKVICKICGKEYEITESHYNRNISKGGDFYCSRECYNKRSNNPKRLKRSTEHNQELLNNGKCADCGEDKYYLLQIHHIDSNPSNNVKENLEIVCANCHIKRHLKLDSNNRYVYAPKELTDRNLLKKL